MSHSLRKRPNGTFLLLMSVCVAAPIARSATAQDEPVVINPYDLKRAKKAAPKLKVDPVLVRALSTKVAECYEREQKAPINEEDKALLKEYGAQVVQDLADALATTGCGVGERASKRCLEALDDLECDALAAPIVAAGWDRNLTPEARAHVTDYAGMLSRREARCAGRAEEEAAIVQGIRGDRLALLIEAQLVIGQCELHPENLPDCETVLQNATCQHLSALSEIGALQKVCSTVLKCVDAPEVDGLSLKKK